MFSQIFVKAIKKRTQFSFFHFLFYYFITLKETFLKGKLDRKYICMYMYLFTLYMYVCINIKLVFFCGFFFFFFCIVGLFFSEYESKTLNLRKNCMNLILYWIGVPWFARIFQAYRITYLIDYL